ncbi:class I adenylate-forming enzyme family protein [Hamadaea tsunoensis]|uniref:class I adenylate-forming enzyme family protein n=1 Tax=Hamadaea tsunoensis TaxID=53368 RepID=UPI000426A678|nr:class I adenylate-forming enzyme family protein [Hamadaea tsunoensis]
MTLVADVLSQNPAAPAFAGMSFGELRRQVLAVRHGLITQGLRPGDGVLFSVRPSARSLVLALAIVAAGGVVVFADPGAGPEMFAARLRLARPRFSAAESILYAGSRLAPIRWYARRGGLLLPDLSALDVERHVYTGRWLPGVPRGALSFDAMLSGPAPSADVTGDPDAPAAVIFTSGTTSAPRAVVHSGGSLGAARTVLGSRVRLGPGDAVYTDQLMLGLPALAGGAQWVLPGPGGVPADATHLFAIPVRLAEMLAAGPLPASLRYVLTGSAPAPAQLLRRAAAAAPGAEVLSIYGMTEILPVAVVSAAEKLAHDGDFVGAPLPGVAARLAGDGELLLSGPNLCTGYLGLPPHNELPTGDLARLDPDGIVLLGRKKDMIIRGKFNLYPGLYEPAVGALPGVREAAFVGLADPGHGDEEVVLCVVVDPAAAADPSTVVERLRARLPHVIDHDALPDRIVALADLPRGGRTHKLDRAALRELVRR